MSKSAFKLRSGNTTPFKQMGSTVHKGTTIFGKPVSEIKQGVKNYLLRTPTGRLYEKVKKHITKSGKEGATEMAHDSMKRMMMRKPGELRRMGQGIKENAVKGEKRRMMKKELKSLPKKKDIFQKVHEELQSIKDPFKK